MTLTIKVSQPPLGENEYCRILGRRQEQNSVDLAWALLMGDELSISGPAIYGGGEGEVRSASS
jgi:hypothetical protein